MSQPIAKNMTSHKNNQNSFSKSRFFISEKNFNLNIRIEDLFPQHSRCDIKMQKSS